MNRSSGIAYCVYPCPCGYYSDPTKECTCAPSMVTRYQKRISGPLLDPLRVDIHIEVPRVPYEKLTRERVGEPSSVVSARVQAARERQHARFASHDAVVSNARLVCNADMTPADVRVFCKLDATGQSLMRAQRTALGDAKVATLRAGVSSYSQDRADDCRFGGERRDCSRASGRGDSTLSGPDGRSRIFSTQTAHPEPNSFRV